MAIVVGDVVEIGLAAANGDVQKVLGVVEHDDGDTLRIFTGCLPMPTRAVPRVSLRRVWGSAAVQWGAENTTEVTSVTHTIQRRARRRAMGMTEASSSGVTAANAPRPNRASSSDDLEDEEDGGWSFDATEPGTVHSTRSLYGNPIRLVCAVCEDLCSWRNPTRTSAFLIALSLWWLTGYATAFEGLSLPALALRVLVQPTATVLFLFATCTAQPSPKCSAAWVFVLLATLGLMWVAHCAMLGVPALALCCLGGLAMQQLDRRL